MTTPHSTASASRRVMVRYRLRPDQVATNEALVRDVYAELARAAPPGLRYATFKLPDGETFVHVASIATPDGVNPLTSLAAFQRFTAEIKQRCVEPPVTSELTEVGAYHFFEA